VSQGNSFLQPGKWLCTVGVELVRKGSFSQHTQKQLFCR
jgi:hypothetical protein